MIFQVEVVIGCYIKLYTNRGVEANFLELELFYKWKSLFHEKQQIYPKIFLNPLISYNQSGFHLKSHK